MKKVLFLFMALMATLSLQAQTIKKGDKFWDGRSLYTVQEVRMGTIVYMTTAQDNELTLEKVTGKNGEYKIIPSRQAEDCLSVLPSSDGVYSMSARTACIFWLFVSPMVMLCGRCC